MPFNFDLPYILRIDPFHNLTFPINNSISLLNYAAGVLFTTNIDAIIWGVLQKNRNFYFFGLDFFPEGSVRALEKFGKGLVTF